MPKDEPWASSSSLEWAADNWARTALGWQGQISCAVAAMSLAVIILVLRDNRLRISMQVLLILVAFAALGACAVRVLVDAARIEVESRR